MLHIVQDRDTTTGEGLTATMIDGRAESATGSLGPIEVHAAGGVVWRPKQDRGGETTGRVEVLLVHRPRYDDWSIPKGKRDPGETDEECARREVLEETGLRVELGREIAQSEYIDRKGRTKSVRYWAMSAGEQPGSFEPNDEVDELRWLSPRKAAKLVSYAADALILRGFDEAG